MIEAGRKDTLKLAEETALPAKNYRLVEDIAFSFTP